MTYQTERAAIEAYLKAQWSDTPIIFDAQKGKAAADTIRLTINNGSAVQGSIGRGANRLDYVGVVQIQIFTEAGKGSAGWRGYAETLDGIFRDARLTTAGAAITAVNQEFIRFSPQQQHPYVSGTVTHAGIQSTTFNAPFVRYETE